MNTLYPLRFSKIIPALIFLGFFAVASCTNSTSTTMIEEPLMVTGTVNLDNDRATAYMITSIEGEGIAGEIGVNNPEIILEVGRRYTFNNEAGASSHPLEFRNAEGEVLLSQREDSGLLFDNAQIDAIVEGDAITFTLTSELAETLEDYICGFHPGMNGKITTVN